MEQSLLPDNLRVYRLKHGFTQKNIADMLGMKRSAYTYYEMGKTTPNITTLYNLAQFYAVPMEALFESHPEAYIERMRPGKKVADDINEIRGLSGNERSIIAILRSRGTEYTQELLEQMKESL